MVRNKEGYMPKKKKKKKEEGWVVIHVYGELVKMRMVDLPDDLRLSIEEAERENDRLKKDPIAIAARKKDKRKYQMMAMERKARMSVVAADLLRSLQGKITPVV
jgi:hypothetical protein